MDEKNKPGIIEMIANLSSAAVKTSKDITALAKAETEWSIRHILSIVFVSSLFRTFLMLTWFSLCGVMVAFLLEQHYSLLYSIATVAGVNGILSIGMGLFLLKLKSELAFLPATKRQLKAIFGREDAVHE